MLDVIDVRVPRVQLDRADLDQTEETGKIIDPEPRAFAAFALFDRQRVNRLGDGRQLSLVVEGRASDVTDELERPAREVGQRPLPDLCPVRGEFLFRGRLWPT